MELGPGRGGEESRKKTSCTTRPEFFGNFQLAESFDDCFSNSDRRYELCASRLEENCRILYRALIYVGRLLRITICYEGDKCGVFGRIRKLRDLGHKAG